MFAQTDNHHTKLNIKLKWLVSLTSSNTWLLLIEAMPETTFDEIVSKYVEKKIEAGPRPLFTK